MLRTRIDDYLADVPDDRRAAVVRLLGECRCRP
jgi:hypothetical protein